MCSSLTLPGCAGAVPGPCPFAADMSGNSRVLSAATADQPGRRSGLGRARNFARRGLGVRFPSSPPVLAGETLGHREVSPDAGVVVHSDCMTTRDRLHELVDQLEVGELRAAEVVLRGLLRRPVEPVSAPPRRFRFAGGLEAEPDLAERSGQIVRDELGRSA